MFTDMFQLSLFKIIKWQKQKGKKIKSILILHIAQMKKKFNSEKSHSYWFAMH